MAPHPSTLAPKTVQDSGYVPLGTPPGSPLGAKVDLLRRNEQRYRDKWQAVEGSSQLAVGSSQNPRELQAPSSPDCRLPIADCLLSLCMIARDNERTIGAALETIRRYVDDIVVVDTGSKDRRNKDTHN